MSPKLTFRKASQALLLPDSSSLGVPVSHNHTVNLQ